MRRRSLFGHVVVAGSFGLMPATGSKARVASIDPAALIAIGHGQGHADDSGSVSLIDGQTGQLSGSLALGHEPYQLAIDQDGGRLLAIGLVAGRLSVVDLDPLARRAEIALGVTPIHLQLSRNDRIFALNALTEEGLWIGDLDAPDRLRQVGGIVEAHNMMFEPDSGQLLVADRGGAGIKRIDPVVAEVLEEMVPDGAHLVDEGALPDDLMIRAGAGDQILLVFDRSQKAFLLDRRSGDTLAGLDLGGDAVRIFHEPLGRYSFLSLLGSSRLPVIDHRAPGHLQFLSLPGEATWFASGWFDSVGGIVSAESRTLTLVELDALGTIETLDLPGVPRALYPTRTGEAFLVILDEPGSVVRIDLQDLAITPTALLPRPVVSHTASGALNYCS